MDKKVVVVIINYNGKADTIACLESVFRTQYPSYEILIVDNGSQDGSTEELQRRFPSVFIVKNPDNRGFAVAGNQGASIARKNGADYVFFLNNDAVVAPDTIGLLIDAAERDKSIGAIGPLILYTGTGERVWFVGGLIDWKRGIWQHVEKNMYEKDGTCDVDAISGCALMVKSSVLSVCGLFDERFFLYGEDVDLCVRIRGCGFRVVCLTAGKVWHKVGATIGGSGSPQYLYYITRNRLLFMKKYAKPSNWIFFAPYFIYSQTKVCVRHLYEKRPGAAYALISGIGDFLFGKFGPREQRGKV